ncbi:Nif3-like dinuclear metal center hexameric protein [bacterium]|nr:Nif3-like dinuclear metal center hexameric protein [bacterium]
MQLLTVSSFLDEQLRITDFEDAGLNGLQVANSGSVTKIATAVDASVESILKAAALKADMLFVHHGLFWGKPVPVTGALYKRMALLMRHDMALYAAHLPLDQHPVLGNNAQIEHVLGWPVSGDFGDHHGKAIGKEVEFRDEVPLTELVDRLRERLGVEPDVWAFGPDRIKRLGYISGGALTMLQQAIDAGLDAFITGEPAHAAYWNAREEEITVIFAGHYATETLGVKAVADLLRQTFDIETVFLDLPTGY